MSVASNNGSVLGGLTSWATSAATNAGFSMAKSAGSEAWKTIAATGSAIVKEIFEDDLAPRVSASSQSRPVASYGEPSDAYASLSNVGQLALDCRLERLRESLGLPAEGAERAPEVPSSNEGNEGPFEDVSLKMVGVIGAVILAVNHMTKASKKVVPVKVAAQTSWLQSQGKILFTAGAVAVAWFAVKPQLQKIPQFRQFINWLDSD